ncbi:MAG: pilus assembly PilX N-terminal domain-containing protein [Candidatus Omnitrophota bacterium]|nr:MAG: pilus assembly PilX N-terminal domain-containing protein [Candidatus Omnitrophota bacterium]
MVKGNKRGLSLIILVFIILTITTLIVIAYGFLITYEMRGGGIELNEQKALYIAETGIERAMEYLEDDTDWSNNDGTAVISENFGDGSYIIDLSGGTKTVIVVDSEATVDSGPRQVKRKVRQKIRRLPEAFNFALFWEGTGTANVQSGSVVVNGGDVFTKGTVSSTGPGSIDVTDGGTPATTNGGFVYTTNSWTAGGTYTEGTKPDAEPAYPILDTTFYDNEIAMAEAQVIGDLSWAGGSRALNGTTYVNGDIEITGTAVTGSGALVATGKINITGSASIVPGSGKFIRLISKTDVTIEASTTATGTVIYARSESEIDNANLTGSFISVDKVKITNGSIVTGYIYTDTSDIRDNATINGSLVTNRFVNNEISALGKTITINYDFSYLEEAAPGLGLDIDGDASEEGGIIKVPGTWQQI